MTQPRRLLFVCLGNICRSPTAQAVVAARALARGLDLECDSAGTAAYHVGNAPDPRSRQAARARGLDMDGQRARQIAAEDFEQFDLILAMDNDNLRELQKHCPQSQQHKLRLFLEFARSAAGDEMPDPYYGGSRGFEEVLDLAESAADGLCDELLQR